MKSRKEIKETAKDLLDHNLFSNKWVFMLLLIFLAGFIISVTTSFFIGILFMGVFYIGAYRGVLAAVRRQDENADIVKLFSGFTDGKLGDNMLLGILIYIFVTLWSLLFVIPGIVKSYSYALSYYVKIDNQELSATDCINKSRELMKGHKWDLFVLDLSFIGWYIVGCLCLGVGVLWVSAYHETARAEFYRSLVEDVDAVKISQ